MVCLPAWCRQILWHLILLYGQSYTTLPFLRKMKQYNTFQHWWFFSWYVVSLTKKCHPVLGLPSFCLFRIRVLLIEHTTSSPRNAGSALEMYVHRIKFFALAPKRQKTSSQKYITPFLIKRSNLCFFQRSGQLTWRETAATVINCTVGRLAEWSIVCCSTYLCLWLAMYTLHACMLLLCFILL